ncbi:MAG: PCRF domain-containing protein, partial [Coprobacillus sp.]|nr:PCRF domain-containing protein [Coprobacillus sp.]
MGKLFHSLGLLFDFDKLRKELDEYDIETSREDFWSDPNKARDILSKANYNRSLLDRFASIESLYNDIDDLLKLNDESLFEELEGNIKALRKETNDFHVEVLFSEKFDDYNAILEIHSGAGGTEAMDWASMLYQMYINYANLHHFKVDILDIEMGEEAGVKSVTFKVSG